MRRAVFRLLAPLVFLCLYGLTAAAGADEPGGKAAAPVEVHLSEYAVKMPQTLPAGPTTFLVHNDGLKIHSFKIEGPGIDQLLSAPVEPKATGTLTVALQAGEYKIYCPISSHAAKGMTTKLVVTAE
jgi:uncharacterized cupredoxin-like copper-binding protein